nr:PREDICTED: ribosomal RNA processing protein 1 homolog B-like isoform X1 [Paralichthys olivaceus]
MASVQDPEVQFAQKLASNEKPVRTKAIKKLRKYINVRSQKATDGFTDDELLKLWKGLFYCLWMQDKPLLQEDLSNQISTLIHSFHHIDGQFLYLESFLQTFKREWTGIDRLRMDKFFQLVRFMFKQTFEMLKRKNWESSVVGRFLELLTAQLLQGGSAAPSGLQFHILDLYMTELAAVGSSELTANQNLMFIEPFCKTAAKTKDRTLFRAICNSIFSSIIDQAPFAIEELMQEVKAAEDCESGPASEGDNKEQIKEKMSKPLCKKWKSKKINGSKSYPEEDVDDELLYSEDSDTELPCDGDIGPVLQFDYTALADKLFELASRNSTLSQNRQRLYKIIKVLQDLGKGIFPQDVYPEEVSTDEDDEMFGSRRRMKRECRPMDEDEKGTPAAKKRKKKQASTLDKQNKDLEKHDSERVDQTTNDGGKKTKRKKKKAEQGGSVQSEENTERSKQVQAMAQSQTPIKEIEEAEGIPQCAQAEDLEKEAEVKIHISIEKVTTTAQDQSETLLLSEVKKQPSVTEEAAQPRSRTKDNKNQTETLSREKKGDTSESKPEIVAVEDQQTFTSTEPEMSPETVARVSGKKNKKKSLKTEEQTNEMKTLLQVSAETEITSVGYKTSAEETVTTLQTNARFPAKKRKLGMKAERKPEGESQIHNESSKAKTKFKEPSDGKRKSKITSLKVNAQVEVEDKHSDTEITSEASQHTTSVPIKRKKKGKLKIEQKLLTRLTKKKHTPKMTPIQTRQLKDETRLQMVGSLDLELPLAETEAIFSKRKLTKNKKRKIPVVFEFEVNQLMPAAQEDAMINAEEETCAKWTKPGNDVEELSRPLGVKTSQKKLMTASWLASDFITFQSNTVAPTPLFCKSRKSQTPEFKKVTFGLKNNKTAEFRKTDRSLLVSPDGSSRVPFDPKQKPKSGVLKSPPTPGSTNLKTTPKFNKKKSLNSLKTTPERRPSAVDFF